MLCHRHNGVGIIYWNYTGITYKNYIAVCLYVQVPGNVAKGKEPLPCYDSGHPRSINYKQVILLLSYWIQNIMG